MQVPLFDEGRRSGGELPRREVVTFRLLLSVGCVVILALGFMYRAVDPGLVDPWAERIAVTGLLAATFAFSFVHRRAGFRWAMYFAGYVTTLWIVRLLVLNGFDEQFALGLLVAFPAISMIFQRRRHLFWYCLSTVLLVGVAAWITPDVRISLLTYLTYVVTLAILSFLILGSRLDAEEELSQSEERFRLLVRNVQDYGIFVLDLEGKVVNCNAGCRAEAVAEPSG